MSDKNDKDEQAERARRLRQQVENVEENGPQTSKDESPRDFINRRMHELEETEKDEEGSE